VSVRLSAVLLLLSLAGILGGAALISVPALGGAVIFVSVCAGVYALGRDDGTGRRQPDAAEPTTLHAILEKARRAG
jgi:hypothetical protein